MSVDVSAWLDSIGQAYQHEVKQDGAEVWHLHPCPFCGKNDAAKDSTIRRGADGKLGWHCFHDSCEGARQKAEAKEQGRKVSSWAILCRHIGRPGLEHVTAGSPGPGPSTAYPSWREREAARAAAQAPPLVYDTMTWDELRRADLRIEWLVPRAIVAGQPIMVGGASKSLKTSIIIDLMVSLAGAAQWLGAFAAPPEPVPCLLISGESGHYALRHTIERVIAERGVIDQGLPLHVATVLPRLSVDEHIEKTQAEIKRVGAKLFAIDPAYLSLLNESSGGDANLFTVGTILRRFNEVAVETGATLCLLHHFRKALRTKPESFVKPTLEDFAYAGFAEWARQWILLKRRSEFLPGSGHHDLYMEVGGSVGQFGQWAVTVDEGRTDDPLEGRTWKTSIEKWDDEKHANPAAARRKLDTRSHVLKLLRQAPMPMSAAQLSNQVGASTRAVQMALQALITEGLVESEYWGRSPVYRYVPRDVDGWEVLE